MKAEHVHSRLAVLRERYVPESVAEAQQRLAAERPARESTPTARSVARALAELRALCELSAVLQGRR